MKCWIEDGECGRSTPGASSGLINLRELFCEGCQAVSYNEERVKSFLEGMGIYVNEEIILKRKEQELIEINAQLLLNALVPVKEKRKEKIPEINDETFQQRIAINGSIGKLKELITAEEKRLKYWSQKDDFVDLCSSIKKVIQRAESEITWIEKEIKDKIAREGDHELESIMALEQMMGRLLKGEI